MKRPYLLDQLSARTEPFDVLVIGGGATGLSCALDAMTRGYSVALVERGDFGEGTSSRSTKLIHGGVRYLRQGHLGLVHESLRERAWFFRAAPDLVKPIEFIIPCQSAMEQLYYRTGMKLYDTIAGATGSHRSASLTRDEVLARAPGAAAEPLAGGVRYIDGQLDDARLLIAMMRRLLEGGGLALNYVAVVDLIKSNGRVAGAVVEDRETGARLRVDARVVINATGVFTDQVTRLDEPDAPDRIAASQGIHLVLDAAYLGGTSALMIPKTSDGRVLFAIPWLGRVIYGTTDTPRDIIEDHPAPLESEIDYLLAHAPHIFARPLSRAKVIASFAGLRPLPKAAGKRSSEVSRDFHVTVSPAGLVSVYGGKLTTCRAMGEAAVEHAAASAGLPAAPSRTNELLLLDEGQPASHLTAPSREDVAYAVEYEMARTVDDVLLRRSRVGLLNPAAAKAAAAQCAVWMAELRKAAV